MSQKYSCYNQSNTPDEIYESLDRFQRNLDELISLGKIDADSDVTLFFKEHGHTLMTGFSLFLAMVILEKTLALRDSSNSNQT